MKLIFQNHQFYLSVMYVLCMYVCNPAPSVGHELMTLRSKVTHFTD